MSKDKKLQSRIKMHKQEISRLESAINDEKRPDYLRRAAFEKRKQLISAVKVLSGKLINIK